MRHKWLLLFCILLFSPLIITDLIAGGEWFNEYKDGLDAMEQGNYQIAVGYFQKAVQGNSEDDQKARTYGMHFIEYFPHREMGICYYHLGDTQSAQVELKLSIAYEPSERAQEYLNQMEVRKRFLWKRPLIYIKKILVVFILKRFSKRDIPKTTNGNYKSEECCLRFII